MAAPVRTASLGQVGLISGNKKPAVFGCGEKKERNYGTELSSVVSDGFDGAALFGFFAARFFFRGLGLLVNIRITPVLVPFEIIRRRFATQVAIDALIVYVILAGGIFRIFICDVCHKVS
jgi:hypothetical protein